MKTPEQIAAEAAEKTAADAAAAAKVKADAAALKAKEKADAATAKAAKKAQDKLDREAAKAKKTQEKEDAKAAALKAKDDNKMPEQNGVRRPKPGTTCAKVWDVFDSVSQKNGSPATISESMPVLQAGGVNDATIRTQYARWRKFHGVTGRLVAAAPAAVTEAPAPEATAQ